MVVIDPILLFVREFDACARFYGNLLGLRPRSGEAVHGEYVEFDAGGVTFALHGGYEDANHSTGPLAIHFQVKDIEAVAERLRSAGVFVTPVQPKEYGVYECTFRDPDGNEFELIQPL